MKKSTILRIISSVVIICLWCFLYYYNFVIVRDQEIIKDGILATLKSYPKLLSMQLTLSFILLAIPAAALSYAIWEMPQDLLINREAVEKGIKF